MERYCSKGQSPQRAVAPTEEEVLLSYGFKVLELPSHTKTHPTITEPSENNIFVGYDAQM